MSLDDAVIAAARPDVIDETFDGEAVLVQLRTGVYYALNARASGLWSLLQAGQRVSALADALARAEQRDRAAARAEIAAFAAQLLAEELVVEGAAAAPLPAELPPLPGGLPELQRFDDMQDLLLLDPIHDLDLDRDGWPIGRDGTRVEPAA